MGSVLVGLGTNAAALDAVDAVVVVLSVVAIVLGSAGVVDNAVVVAREADADINCVATAVFGVVATVVAAFAGVTDAGVGGSVVVTVPDSAGADIVVEVTVGTAVNAGAGIVALDGFPVAFAVVDDGAAGVLVIVVVADSDVAVGVIITVVVSIFVVDAHTRATHAQPLVVHISDDVFRQLLSPAS